MPDNRIIELPISPYDGGLSIPVVDPANEPSRVLMSSVEQGGHDHAGERIDPDTIYVGTRIYSLSGTQLELRNQWAGSTLAILDNGFNLTQKSSGQYVFHARNNVATVGLAGATSDNNYGVTTPNDPARNGRIRCNEVFYFPSSLKLKTNVVEIANATQKCKLAKGITFTQGGKDKAGISAEHLEATGLPNMVSRDEKGVLDGVNELGMIPLLLQAVNELAARVEALEGRK